MNKLISVFLMQTFILTSTVFAGGPTTVEITKAMWSGKDVTAEAQQWCQGKEVCSYKISSAYIGEPKNPKNLSFQIKWKCGSVAASAKTENIAKDAEGRTLELDCSAVEEKSVAVPLVKGAAVAAFSISEKNSTWTPLSPLKYKSSIHSAIMDPAQDGIETEIGPACTNAIRVHLQAKKNFYSKLLENKYMYSAKNSTVKEVRDLEFYHYTEKPAVKDIINNRQFDQIFTFVHNLSADAWFFYVAADSESSKTYGPYRVTVKLRPDARIFASGESISETDSMRSRKGNDEVEAELIRSNPELSSCYQKGVLNGAETGHYHSVLPLLAAEASHIDLIAYFGHTSEWYQMLGEWALQNSKAE